jgi:hypothetical protein
MTWSKRRRLPTGSTRSATGFSICCFDFFMWTSKWVPVHVSKSAPKMDLTLQKWCQFAINSCLVFSLPKA